MNIFHKVTLQSMKRSRTRTIVTITGVILSAAMITAVSTFGISLLSYLSNVSKMKYGDWHVAFFQVSNDFIEEQNSDKEVQRIATTSNLGCSLLQGAQNPNKPYLFIDGFDEKAFQTLPIYLLSGRLPQNDHEVIISGSIATNGGVNISNGDTLSVTIGNRMSENKILTQRDKLQITENGSNSEIFIPVKEKEYTVVGICQTPVFTSSNMPGYTVITKIDETEMNKDGDVNVFVTLKDPRHIHSYIKNKSDQIYTLNDDVLRFLGLSDDNIFNVLLFSIGGIVILIIMIGSIFLIYNAFYISMNERTHQFGILSSIGATEAQLKNSVLFEGLCIGAVGIPIGILIGIASIGIVITIVARNFQNIILASVPLTLTVSIPVLLIAAATSLITILISAYIPARKAASTPVMECIRQTNEIKIEAKAIKTSRFEQTLFGLEGALALKNFKRNKKRYQSIVLSLVLSVVLFVSASSFVAYMKQASECVVEFTTYDICFVSKGLDDTKMMSIYNKLKYADEVRSSSIQADMKYSCTVNSSELSEILFEYEGGSTNDTVSLPVDLRFLEDDTYLGIINDLKLPVDEYTGPNAKMIAVAKMEGRKDRLQEVDEFSDMFQHSTSEMIIAPKTNDEVVSQKSRDVTVHFVETVPPDALPVFTKAQVTKAEPFVFVIMLPYSQLEQFESKETPVVAKGLTFSSNNCNKTMHDILEILNRENISGKYDLYNLHSMFDLNTNLIFIVNVFSYSFIIMISLIAIANVFNTISTNIKLRKRELAMLRSVGMSEQAFQKMMNYECIFFGLRALLVGLPLSMICSWLIYKGMYIGGADNIDYMVPWTSLGISIFSVLFIVFITMLYSINKIKRENIIDALRDDMA